MNPTDEQAAAVKAFASGGSLVLEAGAGTGKTSTLRMMAAATPARRGIYIAYNKTVATDAQATFPSHVACQTAHAIAFRAVGHRYRHRLSGPRLPTRETARLLGIRSSVEIDGRILSIVALARAASDTVTRFCYSADPAPAARHVPHINGIESHNDLAALVLPYARRAWEDAQNPDGRLKYQHDFYLKAWSLSAPTVNADFVLLDEAQDTNACVASVVATQPAQQILVGDGSQAIYGWRHATDCMRTFCADTRLALTQSFRFGDAIAEEANKWLTVLAASLRLRGLTSRDSTLAVLSEPDAVLCRTNAEAVARVLDAQQRNVPAALVGGGGEVRRMAEAARELQASKGTWHPELVAFQSWQQVQEYVAQDGGGRDLQVFVRLIDSYGAETIIKAVDATVPERDARVIVSTAHRAKGREWGSVKIATDFTEPTGEKETNDPGQLEREEAMLAYVAVTRAKRVLDRAGLAWIDRVLADPKRWPRPMPEPPDAASPLEAAASAPISTLSPSDASDHGPINAPGRQVTGTLPAAIVAELELVAAALGVTLDDVIVKIILAWWEQSDSPGRARLADAEKMRSRVPR